MTQTILITGGLGFIGSNLVRRILQESDDHIIVFDRVSYAGRIENLPTGTEATKRVQFIRGDVTQKNHIASIVRQCQAVIHLAAHTNAAISFSHPEEFFTTNTIGTLNVLEAIAESDVQRAIIASSSEVYGNSVVGIPMDEMHPCNPVSPYAVSKLAADRLAYSYHAIKNLPITILRPFNTYGQYQHTEKMIPRFITQILTGNKITLYNGGYQERDWISVNDHTSAIIATLYAPLEKVRGEIFNIGTGYATTIRVIALAILHCLGKDELWIQETVSDKPETRANIGISKKAKDVIKWEARTSLEDGIKSTVQWYQEHEEWWRTLG